MREDIKKIRNLLKEYAKLKKELANFSQLASPAMDSVSCHVHKMVLKIVWYIILTRLIKLKRLRMPLIRLMIHDTNSSYTITL